MNVEKNEEILEGILDQLLSYQPMLNYNVPESILTKIIKETVSIEELRYLAVKAGEIILEKHYADKNSLLYVIEHLPYPSRRLKTSSLRIKAWKKFKKLNPTDADLWFVMERANPLREFAKKMLQVEKG